MTQAELIAALRELPRPERERVVEAALTDEIDPQTMAKIERRYEKVVRGEAEMVEVDDVRDLFRARLRS